MKICYLCFLSNGFDDHFMKLVCSSMGAKEFLSTVVREYWKSSVGLKDAAGVYVVAVCLDPLQAKAIGLFKIEKDGKLYAYAGHGEYSGKAESAETLQESAENKMNE